MAAQQNVVRTLTIRAKDEGLDQVSSKLKKVGQEAKQAGEGVKHLGETSTQGVARLGNLDRQLESLDKRLAGAPRAFAQFERDARLLQRGLDAGKVSAAEFSRQMAELQTRLQKTVAPRLGVDVDASGLRRLIDGQIELDAATRRTILTVVRQQEQIERAMDAAAQEVAEFATELDRLRAKYNPAYAAAKQYDAELKELNKAHKLGAINAQEHASALEALKARFDQAASGADAFDANSGAAQQRMRNLAFQFQDIGTMLASGQSPFILLAQQLPQVTMYGGQLTGVMGALKQSIAGIFSPLGLLTTGFVLAGSAAISYFRDTNDEADATADVLRDQENLIQRVADRWGDAVPALREYAKGIKDAREAADLQAGSQVVMNSYFDEIRKLMPEVNAELSRFAQKAAGGGWGSNLESTATALAAAYDELYNALQDATNAVQDGKDATDDFKRIEEALVNLLNNGAVGAHHDLADALAEIRDNAGSAVEKLKDLQRTLSKGPRLGVETMDEAQERFNFLRRFNERLRPEDFKFRDATTRQSREAERTAERLARAYDRLFGSAQRQIDQMRQEIELVGQYGAAADALRFKFELLQDAREAGIEIGDKEKQKIAELTAAYRELAQELAVLQALDEISFERSLIGLSDADKEILTYLRQIGVEADSVRGRNIAAEMRYNQVLQETQDELKSLQDIGKDAFTSILDLLYETGDIGEKLIGIFAGIGKQFAQMGMERLWKSLTGEGGSIFDGISASAKGSFSPVQAVQVGREIGNAIAPAITDSLKAPMDAYAAAIRKVESGSYEGNYGALGPMVKGDRAYGAYQVMGKNIASWTKEVTGTAMSVKDFLSNRAAQDKVFFTKFGQSLDKFGNFADATSVWFSGRPLSRAGNASDGYLSVPDYVKKAEDVLASYPGIRAGVRDGSIDAANRLAHRTVSKSGQSAESAPGVFDNRMTSGLGVGLAGLGAFFGGMQSGDPLSGALSGAMTGFGAAPMIANAVPALAGVAGIVGVAGGAIVGQVGSIPLATEKEAA